MQIHELNEAFTDLLKGAGSKISQAAQSVGDKISAANVARGTSQQQKTQAQAAKYAERLKQQGYVPSQTVAPQTSTTPQLTTSTVSAAPKAGTPTPQEQEKFQQMVQAKLGQTQPEPQAAAQATAASAQPVQTKQAGPVRTRQAGPVATGQAGAIMTTPDFQAAVRQLGMNTQQIEKLAQTVQSNPAFANTLLKQLGLKR